MKKLTLAQQIKQELNPDTLGKNRNGNYVMRFGFFYTHGITSQKYVDALKVKFPNAIVVNHGKVWLPFRGGASIANQSHWYVEFKFDDSKDS